MSEPNDGLRFAETHEWFAVTDNGTVRVGISDHAQEELGDLVFVQVPDVGRVVSQGEACAVVESVKTASDLHSPVSGEVIAVNEALSDSPESINDAPYEAWIFEIKPDAEPQTAMFMDHTAYQSMLDN